MPDYTLRETLYRKDVEVTPPPDPGPEDLYGEWGFTIYRTAYGPRTDTYWEALLQTIRGNLRASITQYYEGIDRDEPVSEDEKEAGKLLLNLFRLDERSGLNLKDKSLDDLRDSYHKEPFRWRKFYDDPHNPKDEPWPCIFFVADDEVLKRVEAGTYIFKCVDMDFYHREYKPHPRVPQSYWGWMPITPLAVLPLWQEYNDGGFELELVAPAARFEHSIRTWTDPDSMFNF